MKGVPKVYELILKRFMEAQMKNGLQPDHNTAAQEFNKLPNHIAAMLVSDAIEERLKYVVHKEIVSPD